MQLSKYLSPLLLLLSIPLLAQPLQAQEDFASVDSFARTIKYHKDIYRLTKELTNPYAEDLLKTRSIFIWITDNISYDYRLYNSERGIKQPICRTGRNCDEVYLNWEKKYLNKILQKKKGICDGYARLFKKMCDIAGIKSEIIIGYTKTKPYQIGITGPVNHAWNAVWIDSAYHLLDATWAAGYCVEDENTEKLTSFKKAYNDYYWLTPFADFSRNHFPKEGKWVLEPNYTKERFAANPYYSSAVLTKIQLKFPTSGIIQAKKGDTLRFQFDYADDFNVLQVNSNIYHNPSIWKEEKQSKRRKILTVDTLALKKQQYIPFKQTGSHYEFDYIVSDNSLYYLDILFDFRKVLRFKVKVYNSSL
jgi:hypothetical protein